MTSVKSKLALAIITLSMACATTQRAGAPAPTLDRAEKVVLGDSTEVVASTLGEPDVRLKYLEPAGTAWVYFRGSSYPGVSRLSVFFSESTGGVSRISWNPQSHEPESDPKHARERYRSYVLVEKESVVRDSPHAYFLQRSLEDDLKNFRIVISSNQKEVETIIWETKASRAWEAAHSKDGHPAQHKLAPGERERLIAAADAAAAAIAKRSIGSDLTQ